MHPVDYSGDIELIVEEQVVKLQVGVMKRERPVVELMPND